MSISTSIYILYGFPSNEKWYEKEEDKAFCERMKSEQLKMFSGGNMTSSENKLFFCTFVQMLSDEYYDGILNKRKFPWIKIKDLMKNSSVEQLENLKELAKELQIGEDKIDWYICEVIS